MPIGQLLDNFIGKTYNYLTIIREIEPKFYGKQKRRYAECQCKCGNTTKSVLSDVMAGHTTSCGCRQIEITVARCTKHGEAAKISSEYKTWKHIRQRCTNPNDSDYSDYGGRGIKVCDRWMESFENFLADMGRRPSAKHSLDRYPNNDGNYEPSNCRWGTTAQQARGKRNNHWIEHGGEKMILQDWANRFGISASNLLEQLQKKSIDEVVRYFAKKACCLNIQHQG